VSSGDPWIEGGGEGRDGEGGKRISKFSCGRLFRYFLCGWESCGGSCIGQVRLLGVSRWFLFEPGESGRGGLGFSRFVGFI